MDNSELSIIIAKDIVQDTETRVGDIETDLYEWRSLISKRLNEHVKTLPHGRVIRMGDARYRPLGSDRGFVRSRLEHCADLTAKDLIADCYKDTGHEYSDDDTTRWSRIILAGITKYLQ